MGFLPVILMGDNSCNREDKKLRLYNPKINGYGFFYLYGFLWVFYLYLFLFFSPLLFLFFYGFFDKLPSCAF
jgi:hypothetical protein